MKGTIKRRGKDPQGWSLIYDAPRVDPKKRNKKFEAFHGTKAQAEARLRQILSAIDTGEYTKGKETVGEFLDFWIASREKKAKTLELSPATVRPERSRIEHHIKPVLGSIRLSKLTPLNIESALEAWKNAPALSSSGTPISTKATISTRMVHHIFSTLSAALEQARKWEKIRRNPCENVTPPKKGQKSLGSISLEEGQALLAHQSLDMVHVACVVSLLLGLRRSEVLALTWDDFRDGQLFITKALTDDHGKLRVKENKTKNSRRSYPLPAYLNSLLTEYAMRARGEYLFGPIGLDTFTKAVQSHLKSLGIKATPQRLRHAFNSLGRLSGSDDVVRSRMMGHAQVHISNDIYTTTFESQQTNVLQSLEQMLRE